MKKIIILCCLVVCASLSIASASYYRDGRDDVKIKVSNKIQLKARPFPLTDVRLLDGPFKEAMLRDQKTMLDLDIDRLLHMYRVTAGLPSSAKPFGGWEAPEIELRGHVMGHFLSGLALMYSSTGDERFKLKGDAVVKELAIIQEALKNKGFNAGYLSAFPEELFDRVDKRVKVWAPYYTIHKTMAGLFDMYMHCDNKQALDVLLKKADWVKFRVDRLTDEQQQKVLDTEYGGMNDIFAHLYSVSGNQEHLRLSRKFDHKVVMDPLAAGVDKLDGLHANTQIPKAIGAARDYELTGEERYSKIATFFWERVAKHRSFVIGGHSNGERFNKIEYSSASLSEGSTETCNTYNMLKLTRHLFSWEPSADLIDFYERGLLNHILASEDPETGGTCYYVPLKSGAFKTYSNRDSSFWCCTGTGYENHAKYPDSIYFHNDNSLWVNLFIASELKWKEKGLTLTQATKYPDEETSTIALKLDKPVKLALKVRYPSWAKKGMSIAVNGRRQVVDGQPGSYVTIDREWKDGDTINLQLPMSLYYEAMPDDPNMIALLYGPLVLAGDFGNKGLTEKHRYGTSAPDLFELPPVDIPIFVGNVNDVIPKIKKQEGNTFVTMNLGDPNDVKLIPFYKAHNVRYAVYWKVYSRFTK